MASAAPPRSAARRMLAPPGEREFGRTAPRCVPLPREERVVRPEGGRALGRPPQGCCHSTEPDCSGYVWATAHGGILACPMLCLELDSILVRLFQLGIFSYSALSPFCSLPL